LPPNRRGQLAAKAIECLQPAVIISSRRASSLAYRLLRLVASGPSNISALADAPRRSCCD
jgi:hypothetical protein